MKKTVKRLFLAALVVALIVLNLDNTLQNNDNQTKTTLFALAMNVSMAGCEGPPNDLTCKRYWCPNMYMYYGCKATGNGTICTAWKNCLY